MNTKITPLTNQRRPNRSPTLTHFEGNSPSFTPAAPELAEFKERLLRQALGASIDYKQHRLFRLVASEAEALAWQTPFPLLFLPALLEEKLAAATQYHASQSRMLLRH